MIDLILIVLAVIFLIFIIWLASSFFGAPFQPSSNKELQEMIEISEIKKNQKVADLGSGNGKVVIEFAKKGAEVHGFEINPFLVWLSRRKIKKLGLEKKAFIHQGNFWNKDFSDFDIVILFQIYYVMHGLEEKLKGELRKGAKIISNTWRFPHWKSEKQIGKIYLYKI